jgi:protein dithiol:quinone oxidoreductase
MEFRMKAWHLHLLIFAACSALLGYASYYLQGTLDLAPCPLCILQRFAFILLGGFALAAALHRPRGTGRAVYAGLMLASVAAGVAFAARQLYVVANPSVSCRISAEERFVNGLPLAEWWPAMFQATGECGGADPWTFLGMSIPTLALIAFVALGLLVVAALRLRS